MSAIRLSTIRVEKPWGRLQLWPGFAGAERAPVGEVWFDAPPGVAAILQVKYLFTSERLSIQVHPDDDAARATGYPHGKDEAWVVLAAAPDSTIAYGLKHALSREALRAAALDGSIEALLDWRPVKAGDVIYSQAGTIHAIGAGLTIIEVQQNIDLTYRLYDYGRPRELHLDAGLAVADCAPLPPFTDASARVVNENVEEAEVVANPKQLLVSGRKFRIERWTFTVHTVCHSGTTKPCWLIPVSGGGTIDGVRYAAGECWVAQGAFTLEQDAGSELLCAIPASAADAAVHNVAFG